MSTVIIENLKGIKIIKDEISYTFLSPDSEWHKGVVLGVYQDAFGSAEMKMYSRTDIADIFPAEDRLRVFAYFKMYVD